MGENLEKAPPVVLSGPLVLSALAPLLNKRLLLQGKDIKCGHRYNLTSVGGRGKAPGLSRPVLSKGKKALIYRRENLKDTE